MLSREGPADRARAGARPLCPPGTRREEGALPPPSEHFDSYRTRVTGAVALPPSLEVTVTNNCWAETPGGSWTANRPVV
jgi:hypothetical protein